MRPVWQYFEKVNNDTVECLLCQKHYSRKGRSTTNLKNHLRAMHREDYNNLMIFEEVEASKKEQIKSDVDKRCTLNPALPSFNPDLESVRIFKPSTTIHPASCEDRKIDISSLGNVNFASGQGENSTGSGDVQAGCDDVSMPLSPEQFLSEEMDHGTSPPPTPSQRPESYKLRHNNHLNLVLESLAGDESFMDVTLTAQGKAIKAHKSVLSAVSPYFRSVLKENPCQHPIIIMPRDIRFEELNNIISYVYKGEMTVAAEDLASLLKTAEILQVTGLSPSEGGSSTSNLINQMQGLPSGLFSNTPSSNNSSSSKSSSKKSSKQSHPPPSQYQDEAPASSDDHSRIDPLDFLNTDMTCVKEEITSDNEETNEMTFSSLTADTTGNLANKSYSESPNVGGDSGLSPRNEGAQRRRSLNSSRGVEDPAGKPFIPGESDDPPGLARFEESSQESFSPSPHVCPHCLETHRPNDLLQAHLRLKHPSKPSFVCACGRVFIRQSSYTEHMRKCDV